MEPSKKRLLIIALFGLAAIGAVFLLTDPAISPFLASSSQSEVAPVVPVAITPTVPAVAKPSAPVGAAPAAINGKTPVMPEGARLAGQTVRDIFLPPPEYARMLPQEPKPGVNGGGGGGVGPAPGLVPVLTGIITGDSTRVAILRQGTISRSYRVGESSGAYRIAAIGANSVTLAGPTGTLVLKMGQ